MVRETLWSGFFLEVLGSFVVMVSIINAWLRFRNSPRSFLRKYPALTVSWKQEGNSGIKLFG